MLRFVVTKMAQRQIFLQEFRIFPVTVSQLLLYTKFDIILIGRTGGESLAFGCWGSLGGTSFSRCFF
jgi:hypothetical protein